MHISTWHETLALIAQSIDASRFETWIRPLVPVENSDNACLTLAVENKVIMDFLDQHYKKTILSFSKKALPSIKSIQFVLKDDIQSEKKSVKIKKSPEPAKPPSKNRSISNLNPHYTFDLFVTGVGNEFAKSVSLAVAENPGKTKFNPLLIYGGVGLGKTHLLQAIGNYIPLKNKNSTVNFVTSEEFYFSFIEAIKNSNTKIFTDNFKYSDALLVDDIQFLAGKDRTQEEFFYIFNTLYQSGKQIVLLRICRQTP